MSTFGSNLGYVDELFARYRDDPSSVSEAWQEFFHGFRPQGVTAPAPSQEPPTPIPPEAEPIIGISSRIVENMVASLAVPTATSVRSVPVKLLEENRRLINHHQATIAGPKISFTHLIAWAIVRCLVKHPVLNSGYLEADGKPHRLHRDEVNLGLAIDLERKGRRILLVPCIRDAATLDFPSFVSAYNDLVLRARQNRLAVEDFQGTTVTLTNPGMLGTATSVPRLMEGQGAIIGIGSIGYPAEFAGMDTERISAMGISKIMAVSSTYDHRIIQGAESGTFLSDIEKMIMGQERFYHHLFQQLSIPYEPFDWAGDFRPQLGGGGDAAEEIRKQNGVVQLLRSYRVRGHLWADLDPMGYHPEPHEELEMSHYGLSVWDLDRRFLVGSPSQEHTWTPLRDIMDNLRDTYCRHIGVEFMHIPEPAPRAWLQQRMESSRNEETLDFEAQKQVLRKLNAAEAFERFLHTSYVGHKRFSLEGADSLIAVLDALLSDAAGRGIREAVIGMAHRGRLNVLANIIGMSYDRIFRKFEGDLDPTLSHGSGDVIYHLGFEGEHTAPDGKTVRLILASNPSHLEAVDPVVEGMVRARQDNLGDSRHEVVLPILIHGDAAFAGQGVVAETLNLSQLSGYRTGGTVHIVVNNQIGFTTGPKDARSSMYSTDTAKAVKAPIFHVNGDYPEDVVRTLRLALEYRQRFNRDVVVDMLCYRRWGHNEADEPAYTHPTLYSKIENHRSVRMLYTEQLLRREVLDIETAETALEDFRNRLSEVQDAVKAALDRTEPEASDDHESVEGAARPGKATAVAPELLEQVMDGLAAETAGFEPHPKLARQLARRRERLEQGRIDWALAEAFAFGTLVLEGVPVRLSGEDSGRGTFSQRHAILYDHRDGRPYCPLANLSPDQASFQVFDSLLSEFAVLGFEYGYSVQHTSALVMWEAQFGDFANGAQVIIDQFIASAQAKWGQSSGIVMLLPHASEGQGPEHSSARLERFLQLCASGNMQVTYPSTPAQYFHLLRRQAGLDNPTPLVVLTPKSILRHPVAVSEAADFVGEAGFNEVLDDPVSRDGIRRVLMCSGKVYYDLIEHREQAGIDDIAVIRVEQFYPFPGERLLQVLDSYGDAREFAWVQEEPRNMGGWSFMQERLRDNLGPNLRLSYCGRRRSASPGTGSFRMHLAEQKKLIDEAFKGGNL
ncbi:MAG: multifunctional oxoglutarate decarboxylase/oxoglutarate dehydrogenase thiamine pyrophosphate-binding subunit/dihydrolipoyllysine-residue succinyltransferase subunit [Acidobacteria bacterium]|uniref:oxoglutarate dehydrogenase (succinyl-transferring) n=1 Tax=Candidatus Polarisedimenticola svalbardensis TaxID=2886004 RepID=A0A8J7CCN0_9BACT|nr:multifunctional oxoglutarate decarboxylase/oxoglutarate dehydrogenase thiamine pyrophosphate-binding subunit/dihydrolipoyllysine-residue succinyltransferase subunit [Candidatus Polarisedimenticola svalbardensis]